MFTGIVEEIGAILSQSDLPEAMRLTVYGPLVTADVRHGDSIAVNGVCLTVVETNGTQAFVADVMKETLERSTLQKLDQGQRVNLERAMSTHALFGGHIVQGHVDGTGTLLSKTPTPTSSSEYWISLPSELIRYLAPKGSIAIDGVSATVVAVTDTPDGTSFQVVLTPTVLADTTLGQLDTGSRINIEVDVLAKYVEKLAPAERQRHPRTEVPPKP